MSPAERAAAAGPGPAPCGRGERRPVRALRRLSERAAPEEPRAAAPADAWAEAVQGWARTAPLACFQLQKQGRKGKAGEPGNSCLICSDMLQPLDKALGQDGKAKRNPSKYDSRFGVDAVAESALGKEKRSTCSKFNYYPTADGIKTELRHSTLGSVQTPQGEKVPLPIKEQCVWNLEDLKSPEGERQKEGKPQGLNTLNPNGPGSSKPSLFPPVKDASPNDTSDPSWKGKMTISSQKRLHGPSVEIAPYNQDAEAVEQEGIKGTDQGMENTDIHEQPSFVPGHTKISLLQEDPKQPPWPGALAANLTTATVPNPIALKKNSHHSCKQLAHLKGIQHARNYDIQGSSTSNVGKRYVENKQEKEAKEKEVPPHSGLLPSVTGSRVARTMLPSRLT